jgi:hypothetical protein
MQRAKNADTAQRIRNHAVFQKVQSDVADIDRVALSPGTFVVENVVMNVFAAAAMRVFGESYVFGVAAPTNENHKQLQKLCYKRNITFMPAQHLGGRLVGAMFNNTFLSGAVDVKASMAVLSAAMEEALKAESEALQEISAGELAGTMGEVAEDLKEVLMVSISDRLSQLISSRFDTGGDSDDESEDEVVAAPRESPPEGIGGSEASPSLANLHIALKAALSVHEDAIRVLSTKEARKKLQSIVRGIGANHVGQMDLLLRRGTANATVGRYLTPAAVGGAPLPPTTSRMLKRSHGGDTLMLDTRTCKAASQMTIYSHQCPRVGGYGILAGLTILTDMKISGVTPTSPLLLPISAAEVIGAGLLGDVKYLSDLALQQGIAVGYLFDNNTEAGNVIRESIVLGAMAAEQAAGDFLWAGRHPEDDGGSEECIRLDVPMGKALVISVSQKKLIMKLFGKTWNAETYEEEASELDTEIFHQARRTTREDKVLAYNHRISTIAAASRSIDSAALSTRLYSDLTQGDSAGEGVLPSASLGEEDISMQISGDNVFLVSKAGGALAHTRKTYEPEQISDAKSLISGVLPPSFLEGTRFCSTRRRPEDSGAGVCAMTSQILLKAAATLQVSLATSCKKICSQGALSTSAMAAFPKAIAGALATSCGQSSGPDSPRVSVLVSMFKKLGPHFAARLPTPHTDGTAWDLFTKTAKTFAAMAGAGPTLGASKHDTIEDLRLLIAEGMPPGDPVNAFIVAGDVAYILSKAGDAAILAAALLAPVLFYSLNEDDGEILPMDCLPASVFVPDDAAMCRDWLERMPPGTIPEATGDFDVVVNPGPNVVTAPKHNITVVWGSADIDMAPDVYQACVSASEGCSRELGLHILHSVRDRDRGCHSVVEVANSTGLRGYLVSTFMVQSESEVVVEAPALNVVSVGEAWLSDLGAFKEAWKWSKYISSPVNLVQIGFVSNSSTLPYMWCCPLRSPNYHGASIELAPGAEFIEPMSGMGFYWAAVGVLDSEYVADMPHTYLASNASSVCDYIIKSGLADEWTSMAVIDASSLEENHLLKLLGVFTYHGKLLALSSNPLAAGIYSSGSALMPDALSTRFRDMDEEEDVGQGIVESPQPHAGAPEAGERAKRKRNLVTRSLARGSAQSTSSTPEPARDSSASMDECLNVIRTFCEWSAENLHPATVCPEPVTGFICLAFRSEEPDDLLEAAKACDFTGLGQFTLDSARSDFGQVAWTLTRPRHGKAASFEPGDVVDAWNEQMAAIHSTLKHKAALKTYIKHHPALIAAFIRVWAQHDLEHDDQGDAGEPLFEMLDQAGFTIAHVEANDGAEGTSDLEITAEEEEEIEQTCHLAQGPHVFTGPEVRAKMRKLRACLQGMEVFTVFPGMGSPQELVNHTLGVVNLLPDRKLPTVHSLALWEGSGVTANIFSPSHAAPLRSLADVVIGNVDLKKFLASLKAVAPGIKLVPELLRNISQTGLTPLEEAASLKRNMLSETERDKILSEGSKPGSSSLDPALGSAGNPVMTLTGTLEKPKVHVVEATPHGHGTLTMTVFHLRNYPLNPGMRADYELSDLLEFAHRYTGRNVELNKDCTIIREVVPKERLGARGYKSDLAVLLGSLDEGSEASTSLQANASLVMVLGGSMNVGTIASDEEINAVHTFIDDHSVLQRMAGRGS